MKGWLFTQGAESSADWSIFPSGTMVLSPRFGRRTRPRVMASRAKWLVSRLTRILGRSGRGIEFQRAHTMVVEMERKKMGVKMAMAGMSPIILWVAKVKLVGEVKLASLMAEEGKLAIFLAGW